MATCHGILTQSVWLLQTWIRTDLRVRSSMSAFSSCTHAVLLHMVICDDMTLKHLFNNAVPELPSYNQLTCGCTFKTC